MSGLIGVDGSGRAVFTDGAEPRRTFGRRRAASEPVWGAMDGNLRSFDDAVPDLRRRIVTAGERLPNRLPLAIGLSIIVGLSAALWLNAIEVSKVLAAEFVALL